METAHNISHFLKKNDLLNILGFSYEDCKKAIQESYKKYPRFKNGKTRWIESPNELLKNIQKKLLEYLQKKLTCPPYCMAGFKGQNNIENAKRHRFKREVITTDISHFFPNTKEKYIRKFFKEEFGATAEVLELLVQLTTYNGYLPTGAPTSTLLATFVHKEVLDKIYEKTLEYGADMSSYVDDITISTKGHIGNWIIKYIQNTLKTHGLHIKMAKTKRYGYKYAVVTGVHISQSGKMSAPFSIGHSVIKALKLKSITEMNELELASIIAKISYIQQFTQKVMNVTKIRAIKQLKQLNKIKNSNR